MAAVRSHGVGRYSEDLSTRASRPCQPAPRHRRRPVRLRRPRLRRRPRPGHRRLPLARPGPAAAARGRGGSGQDRGGPHPGRGARRRADPAPVLRGARHQHRGVRVGLSPADARDPAARGARRGQVRRHPGHLQRGVPDPAAAAPGAGEPRGRAAGAADRRGGPGRRGVRGLPARAAERFRGHAFPRSAPSGPAPAARDPDQQPDPRGARRAQAALPLPLDRLSHRRARAGDPPGAAAARCPRRWPRDRRLRAAAPDGRPHQGARHRRDARLGRRAHRAGRATAWSRRRSSRRSGVLLKYQEDVGRCGRRRADDAGRVAA